MKKTGLFKDMLEIPNAESRIRWIDYAKGFAIILVLIAHGLSGENWFNIWAYSFHLPVFFIISGLLISRKKLAQPLGKLLKKYLKSLILPYYLLAFCVLIVEIVKDVIQKDFSTDHVLGLLYDWVFLIGIKADWFLPCLFFAVMFNILLFKLFRGNRLLWPAAIIVLTVIGYLLPGDFEILNMLLRGCIASFFVCTGMLLSELKSKCRNIFGFILKYKIPLTVLLLALNVGLTVLNGKVSLLAFNFGKNGLLYLLNGIVGSLMLLMFCKLIENLKLRLIDYCGRNSVVIMATHMEIMALIGTALGFVLSETSVIYIVLNIVLTFFISVLCIPFVNKILALAKIK